MASKVKIANLALARLGVSQITSLTDNTIEAKFCNLLFEEVVKEVSLEGAFSSTINRATLNVTDNTPAFGYDYEFQLPTDPLCLRVLSINEDTPGTYDFRVEGDKLLANISTIKIKYIGYLENSGSYDEALKTAIVAKLAAELAYPLTGSQNVANILYRKYQEELERAKSIDGQNGSSEYIYTTDLTTDIR